MLDGIGFSILVLVVLGFTLWWDWGRKRGQN